MDSFPLSLHISNRHKFNEINYKRIKTILRQEIYESIITRKDENDYIDLFIFCRKYCGNSEELINKITGEIRSELHELGWKTALSYNDTGLFIFVDEKPTSCW